jgi:predicted HTH transcriptional regulator
VLVALLVATLSSLMTASLVMIGQGLVARAQTRRTSREREIIRLMHELGAVAAGQVAERLDVDNTAAERLLRGLVDDRRFTMGPDDEAGVMRYWAL